MATQPESRPYHKVARAEKEKATKRRITEAAVDLHGSVGPANTTVTELAKAAGVSRMTVYNHFPTESDLFEACSRHWLAGHPLPDVQAWAEVDPPADRLRMGLTALYSWYAANEAMLGHVFRDMAVLPALTSVMSDFWSGYVDSAVAVLGAGWSTERKTVEPAIRLGVSFETWRTLRAAGLDDAGAVELAAGIVDSIA